MGESTLFIPRLIVGLGNPGTKYAETRHNVGFDVIDLLSQRWQIAIASNRRFQGIYGEGTIKGQKVGLLKPETYMNRSGQSVRAVMDWYKYSPDSVLIVYDDMDLPVGRLRLRLSGSAGGHNGMKSIVSHLGTQAFPRLRLGIGSTEKVGDRDSAVVAHVLGRFSPAEKSQIQEVLEIAADAVQVAIAEGIEKSMSVFNGRNVISET